MLHNPGTGAGVSIPACSQNSNFGGTTANLAWGPTGKLRGEACISACDVNADDDSLGWRSTAVYHGFHRGPRTAWFGNARREPSICIESLAYFVVLDRDFSGTEDVRP